MTDPYRPKGLSSAVCYRDAKAAFRWLEAAFGFEPLFVILDADGNLGHSEMTFGNSVVMVGNEWSADHKSPKSVGGKNTQTVHVQLAQGEDLDAHCERARKAGAQILQEPQTQFYGDRTYRARDPEGHIWTFGVTEKRMTPEEWDKASGLTTKKRLDWTPASTRPSRRSPPSLVRVGMAWQAAAPGGRARARARPAGAGDVPASAPFEAEAVSEQWRARSASSIWTGIRADFVNKTLQIHSDQPARAHDSVALDP
jgi:uncharacterized glyoxalase superfamily protein PhnB